jgi:hypothetical protein
MDTKRCSLALFGHAYRLDLLQALSSAADRGVVITELANKTDVAASVFYPPLRGLAELGLVTRLGPTTGSRKVPYRRTDSPAWEPLGTLVDYLLVAAAAESGGRA